GLVTPCGNDVASTWAAMLGGVSGVDYIRKFDTEKYSVKIAAEVKDFDPLNFLEKKEARRMGAFTHFAIAASDEAIKHSNLKIDDSNSEMIGTYISSGIGDFWAIEREHDKLLENGPGRVSPFFIPQSIVNLAAGNVSIRHGAKGPNSATATACSAGAHAIGDSFRIIERGDADVMICGGAESAITPMSVAGFASMRALSTRNDEPKRASRPFDLERDGFVIGEGAGLLIIEELEFAKKRGAKIYAEIVGYGMSGDAFHVTMPDETGSGAIRVMTKALKDAAIAPEQIGYINAHGTSTSYNDKFETLAIKKVFGEHAYKLAVSSTKSMTGHALGAAGGIEAVFSVLTLRENLILPTINYENPDPDCDLDYVPNEPRHAEVEFVLSNSFGFGGTNACLIFKRYNE
ncbi:MAG: beta-ketoacyl-ACP synthase II, partial [Actinomycetota bacterium]